MATFARAIAGLYLTILLVDAQTLAGDPAAILASARTALGGEQHLSSIRSFVAGGRTRQVRGDNLVPIEFEISCELPDKYSRRDEIAAQETGPILTGFNGNALIQIPSPPTSAVRGGPPNPAPPASAGNDRLATLKHDFARLMLGMFAASFSSFPLTFSYVGTAEAPQGQADVIGVTGPANFAVRFFIDKTTHLPLMVSWQPAPGDRARGMSPSSPNARGGPGPGAVPLPPSGSATSGRAGPPDPVSPTSTVETRLYFADYRDVDGVKWPFRIRRAVGADTVEETTFDRFRVNVRIDPRKFEVR